MRYSADYILSFLDLYHENGATLNEFIFLMYRIYNVEAEYATLIWQSFDAMEGFMLNKANKS